MRRALGAAALLAALAAPLPACAQVTVRFVAPERYTDAENRFGSGPPLRVTLAEMRRLFESLGGRVLAPGQSLDIDVLDIDLAGFDQPGANAPFGLRVVNDVTPPRFRIRYALREGRRTVLAGEEAVSDLNFLTRYARSSSGQAFFYERELLRDWFQARIAERRPPRT
ncbi:DUF3016 domain-containing protein [Methylorubrum salsuginis]|uniref:DUF3016 domain-containing protein n=1 Tax=Methylorubrum salsuginis TaxID=414703 RepID=A0A1I4HUV1_9HYPH|nr:DUF3016 domain-containing protein [Methylorubrum salsuginis]SFL45968.1 Protein of unknown function [Methylorubrum salsuginis]